MPVTARVRYAPPLLTGKAGTWNYLPAGGTGEMGATVFCPHCGEPVVFLAAELIISPAGGEALTAYKGCDSCHHAERYLLAGWDV